MSHSDNDNSARSTLVRLNVGGTLFMTSRATLQKDVKSMLHALVNGGLPSTRDETGAFFLDRDGKHFSVVLNYLRDGDVDLPDSSWALRQIEREAKFYQLQGLERLVQKALHQQEEGSTPAKSKYAIIYLGGYGNASQVYTAETTGGFSVSCEELDKLGSKGYRVEGVLSGAAGHYYAIASKAVPDDAESEPSPLVSPTKKKSSE